MRRSGVHKRSRGTQHPLSTWAKYTKPTRYSICTALRSGTQPAQHLVTNGNKQAAVQCTLDQCTSEKQTPGHPDRCVVSKLERCQQTGTVRLHFEAHSTQRPEHSALALALPSERGGVTALDDVIMTQQASWCELHTDQDGLYKVVVT